MKKFNTLIVVLVLSVSMLMLMACGKVTVDYDLASGGATMTYSTVINMQNTPKRYVNKTFRIRGKIRESGDKYYLYGFDSASCCEWTLPLGVDNTDINLDNKTGNVILLGDYSKGSSGYYLDVIGLG